MADKAPQALAVDLYNKVGSFLESLEGRPFPSVYEDHNDLMFAFQVGSMDNTFRVAIQASQVSPGSFLVTQTYSFMTHEKSKGDITIMGVPVYGTFIFNSDLEGIENEEQLYTKLYELIIDKTQDAVMTILS